MIDFSALEMRFRDAGLDAWATIVGAQLRKVIDDAPHGDWPRWQAAIARLPTVESGRVTDDEGLLALLSDLLSPGDSSRELHDALMQLHPWRKGPYRIGEVHIDTEWRSDWKWDRIVPHIEPLADRLVLDVGCGNGYHCWRMALAGARHVIGVDPTVLFLAQYLAIRKLFADVDPVLAKRVDFVPIGIEQVPGEQRWFDTVFSMGVLYHRRSPIDHLYELRAALRPGGQLVLETLVVDGEVNAVLVPEGRYAKMRNVWFIPSTAMLEVWLARTGFREIRTVDVTTTSIQEQRSTSWMRFESLADFLDPADSRLTVEGYPAPKRAVLVATA